MTRALVACTVLFSSANALAFTAFTDPNGGNQPVRWPGNAVTVVLQQDGSADISDGSDLTAVRAAIAEWNQALTGRFTITEGAPTTSRSYGDDGSNRIIFVESGWPGAADGALGTTIPHVQGGSPSTFRDADIILNGEETPWVVDGNPLGVDVQSVSTHELGHLLGLWHAFPGETTMYTGTRRGTTFRHSLTPDDVNGGRFVTNGDHSCTSDAQCPLLVRRLGGNNVRLRCNNGTCAPGAVGYGLECVDAANCTSNSCLRDPWTTDGFDPGACTQACTPGGTPCPNGDACVDVGGSTVCAPGRQCLADADCGGGANDRCLLEFDGVYRCRTLCLRDRNCVSPQRCIELGYGAGLCITPGAKPNGDPCIHPLECAGLACRGANNLRCETAPPRDDGGMSPDVPVRQDAAVTPMPDAGTNPQPDAAVAPVTDASTTVDPIPDPYAEEPPPRQTCSSNAVGVGMPWAALLMLVAALRRFRRHR
jgi:hypothetical protein